MSYVLGERSKSRLEGVHPDLVKVVERAIEITEVDFAVIEGLRTLSRQKELLAKGATTTLNSRHLSGHAVDIAAWVDGTIRWDWPLYHHLAKAMKDAAAELEVDIKWGGDWNSFPDGPHFQLDWKTYPR